MQFDKNGVSGNLTELHVKACTCSNRQIHAWYEAPFYFLFPTFLISIIHFWISKNRFWISINRIMDIQKSNYGYPKFSKILFDFWISINKAEYWISKNRIIDIQKSNNGYPKIDSKNLTEFWISIIRFLDIRNSIFGYT